MNTTQTVTLLVLAVLMFWAVGAYNRIVEMRNAIASAYAQVDAQLRRRHELLPQLVSALRPRFDADHGIFDSVIAASEQAHVAAAPHVRVRARRARSRASRSPSRRSRACWAACTCCSSNSRTLKSTRRSPA